MSTTSIEALVEQTMRDIELRGAGPLVFGYQQVENGVRYAITAQAKEIERLREGLERAIRLIEDAEKDTNWCSGDPYGDGATVSLRALLTKEPTP